MLNKKNKKQI